VHCQREQMTQHSQIVRGQNEEWRRQLCIKHKFRYTYGNATEFLSFMTLLWEIIQYDSINLRLT